MLGWRHGRVGIGLLHVPADDVTLLSIGQLVRTEVEPHVVEEADAIVRVARHVVAVFGRFDEVVVDAEFDGARIGHVVDD